MTLHRKVTAGLAAAVVVVGGQVAWAGAQAAPGPTNPGMSRLAADAGTGLRIERDAAGTVDFVGSGARRSIDNPGVSASTSVRDAARSHLARYGAALGLTQASELEQVDSVRSVSGQDVVRFQQEIDSAPVIGGQVVVSLRADRDLGSMLSTLSSTRSLPAATVTEASALTTAQRAAERASGATGLEVTAQGRAVWDPAVFGGSAVGPAQGVWRFEAADGAAVRRLVLVDDTSGRVLVNLDQIEHLDRVVCDRANVRGSATACTSGFARTETGAASAVTDVNAAFTHAGSVSTAYQEIAGIDLTEALGINVGGQKKLASTVRFCHATTQQGGCPYANAFWNGTQMFYGDTFAVADDVVGHEMTHGIIDQYSELFYWGQSGAINESMADIMGEVVDHRTGGDDDSQWKLSEDLPIGAIRDMKDPTAKGDPDRMTSPLWEADTSTYGDGGGVHFNSGVGNKMAYLVSQGGAFNGQTIVGIDGADTGLTKTGRLYFDAITRLTSGSDYANLAAVLEQSCADFVASGTGGFTAADCANIAKAVLATELRTTPTNAPQPPDAVKSCPAGTTMRELFNSETGAPATKLTPSEAGMWGYGVNSEWGSNATSGLDSWFGYNPDPGNSADPAAASLTTATGIALPAGQKSYLGFQQWRLFEWYAGRTSGPYIDGGTVEVDAGSGPVDTASMSWTNGPEQTLSAYSASFPNQWAGRKAFAGDSFGWTRSELDLSSFAGQIIRPSFTSRGDESDALIGWFLDDIEVFTCDVPAVPPTPTPTPTATPTPTPTPVPTPPVVTKVSSTTTLKIRKGGTVVIARVATGTAAPTGKVAFAVDRKVVRKTVTISRGKAVLRLTAKQVRKLGAGRHVVKATYTGSSVAEPSRATARLRLS
ncbi:Zn-dependent metalloprotease [Nocardioides alpinus]|uniref:Zn-dependent metalloprotease n=1 Tax=Nocardioides alpinus TaxID=748909 RepID=A0A1I1AYX6_9ACTN|nr:M4 family metallopeptidase [Nocardioides alpinus]PKH41461.1 hypothetical protein CXG46_10335 [Nocardioides alpinus]SFB43241.1 Zn-dependent metalloprotease [Nocardioides alpinus]